MSNGHPKFKLTVELLIIYLPIHALSSAFPNSENDNSFPPVAQSKSLDGSLSFILHIQPICKSPCLYIQNLSRIHPFSPLLLLRLWSQPPSSCLDCGNGLLPGPPAPVPTPSYFTVFIAARGLFSQQNWNHSSAPRPSSGAIPRHFSI